LIAGVLLIWGAIIGSFLNASMKKVSILGLCFLIMSVQWSFASQEAATPPTTSITKTEQKITNLSKEKWQWMSDKKVDMLDDLFHEKAVFVHMGGNMTKEHELNVIKSGGIHYKKADTELPC